MGKVTLDGETEREWFGDLLHRRKRFYDESTLQAVLARLEGNKVMLPSSPKKASSLRRALRRLGWTKFTTKQSRISVGHNGSAKLNS